jgi:hypothetical protein
MACPKTIGLEIKISMNKNKDNWQVAKICSYLLRQSSGNCLSLAIIKELRLRTFLRCILKYNIDFRHLATKVNFPPIKSWHSIPIMSFGSSGPHPKFKRSKAIPVMDHGSPHDSET